MEGHQVDAGLPTGPLHWVSELSEFQECLRRGSRQRGKKGRVRKPGRLCHSDSGGTLGFSCSAEHDKTAHRHTAYLMLLKSSKAGLSLLLSPSLSGSARPLTPETDCQRLELFSWLIGNGIGDPATCEDLKERAERGCQRRYYANASTTTGPVVMAAEDSVALVPSSTAVQSLVLMSPAAWIQTHDPLNSPMNSVSSSEDIKPPVGLNGVMKVQAPPPGTPMSLTKHICAICGDRSSGKHYGVYSCEGCKGFFKRTVRKDLTYTCRDNKDCVIDKRQRNRCQYCRYQKCLAMGMKREAVQEERQRAKDRNENEVESTSGANEDMPVEKILEAELAVEPKTETYIETNLGVPSNSTEARRRSGVREGQFCVHVHLRVHATKREHSTPNDPVTNICQAADKQLFTLVEWAKRIPHFSQLPLDDQCDAIMEILESKGYSPIMNVQLFLAKVLTELVSKMRDMQMDKSELGCLRAIVLFNPDSKGLSNPGEVEALREKVYASLEAYCKQKYPEQPGRFAKLLLRLPALRSIGLKCLEHLFFFKLIGDTPIDTFLMEMLEAPHQMT
ncbi:hypothetical protein P4O66_002929 [Electrophorus voltai]|uniref:Retinoic acid receptor RXR n=1 Tax=Electrophorus voltai TaxID=2609070 RepID=A0AAD8YU75_9TELE|nr:hypothetical protein P4O66_002929 [Electrophorus voltai]